MSIKDSRITFVLFSIALVLGSALIAIRVASIVQPEVPSPAKSAEIQLIDTPEYNACEVTTVDVVKSAGDNLTAVEPGFRFGDYAPNDTIADGCSYTISTAKTSNVFLSIQVYDYTETTNSEDIEVVDDTWQEVTGSNPIAYFKQSTQNDTTIFSLRVIPGGKNVVFELRQPTSDAIFDEKTALKFLTNVSSKADFNVIDVESSAKAKN